MLFVTHVSAQQMDLHHLPRRLWGLLVGKDVDLLSRSAERLDWTTIDVSNLFTPNNNGL